MLTALPVSTIRKTLANRRNLLGQPLTHPECDGVLRLLALALPRAGISPADAHDMLELYFRLLHKAGLTGQMLKDAAERYIMRPNDGKPKWFPDPGQLADMCAEDLKTRQRRIAALDKAQAVLDDGPGQTDAGAENQIGDRLRDLAEKMRAVPKAAGPVGAGEVIIPMMDTARKHTDAGELLSTLKKKIEPQA